MRNQFPILNETVYGKPLVYLDNAATSQRPLSVIEKWNEITTKYNSNLHRAVHHLADVATCEYESARDCVRDFINAGSREEIIFTSGATASLNLLAYSYGGKFIGEGDEIIVSEAEHHSNIVPWQLLCERKSAVLKVLPVREDGCIYPDDLRALMTDRTKIVSVAHISNVLGVTNPVKEIINICHSNNCIAIIDGSQGIVHERVDVRDLDCDFYVFSGHKIYAAPGTGVLYGKKDLLEAMPPFFGGGEMIATVKWSGTSYAPLPYKFEAGTQNIAGTPTFVPALQMADSMRVESVEQELSAIRDKVYGFLTSTDGIRLYGTPERIEDKVPLFSFSVEHVHHEDLALILDKMGIATRSGQMCAEPLMDRFGVTGMLRASFAPYNTLEEADYFIKSLQKAIDMLR